MKYIISLLSLSVANSVWADVSATLTLSNDYLFNGISQTGENAAFQGSIDWSHDSGWYAGSFASNVDFPESTNTELDFYAGRVSHLSEDMTLDMGIASYNYFGDSQSDALNYPELYIKTAIHNFEINLWYTSDYFGTGANHGIVYLAGHQNITENLFLSAGVHYSKSFDIDIFSWGTDDDNYVHWHITASTEIKGINISAGYHQTDLENLGENQFLLTISKTFEL